MEKFGNQEQFLSFQQELKNELQSFLKEQKKKYHAEEILKIDMHCHDFNSDVPDELLGRILDVPETWLETDNLIQTLQHNQVDVITITNHNNARSCFQLKQRGIDVLVGTEFSCMVPDFGVGIHVLAYGFDKEQERVLNKLRKNVYKFQRFALENGIPTVWTHPLYHYKSEGIPPMDFFNKMALIFERFEVLNGQRDTWQNLLVKFWLEDFIPEKIDYYCDLYDINPKIYCSNPYKKSFTGGSDSHMGIFPGQTGTYLHVPNLSERRKNEKLTDLALEAIRKGNMFPYGNHQNAEKLTIAFLDYVCQIALNKKDPGLMRIILHKGTMQDKLLALIVSNAFSELQQHKITMRFIQLFHNCLTGKKPALSQRIFIPKVYKPVFDDAMDISKTSQLEGEEMVQAINQSINSIGSKLNAILFDRLNNKVNQSNAIFRNESSDLNGFISGFELPSDIRSLLDRNNKIPNPRKGPNSSVNISSFLDGLSFPFLASAIILGANFTSTKVMYNNRPLLKSFSDKIGKLRHPERLLWLTDTYEDKNGVSMFLQEVLREIKARDLPVDIMVCSSTLEPDDHLIIVSPMAEYKIPYYENQRIRIPDLIEIHNLFLHNEYDRVICSTEGIMGLAALYLKNAYSVKTYFYMHTDWVMFARKTLKIDLHNLSRIRRFLRAYYKAFDGVFVLNSEHQKWLTSNKMGFDKEKVYLTAHWVDKKFTPVNTSKKEVFGLDEYDNVLLFAGRLSYEKGVMDIVSLVEKLKPCMPNLKVVFAGTGPAESKLKEAIPDAVFLGWINHDKLPQIYSAADLLILPSKFDTFSCVVLEAMSCGLPAIAYNTKGPKDIIKNLESGYLVSTLKEMEYRVFEYFTNSKVQKALRKNAIERAKNYNPVSILNDLMTNIGLMPQHQYEKVTIS